MKGVNALKIGVLAAGTLLLASSAIAAGVMYQNVELVNANGQPTAKIVVGSTGAISDGVAAANIASVLANHAYKSSTLTAAVNGQATCAAGGSGTGSGTCTISNQQVTITINLPGVLGNAFQFKTLITDTIDKSLGNRNNTRPEDYYQNNVNQSDTSSTVLSPMRTLSSNPAGDNLFQISGDNYLGFASGTVTDPQASTDFTYQELQSFWVGSNANQVKYDNGASYHQVVAGYTTVAYSILFQGNNFGIPMCTKANDAGDGNWDWCANDSTSQYATANHRMQIWFLGSQWVISSMTPPSTAAYDQTSVFNGGSIKLAKEAKYDIVNVGGVIDGGTFKIRLADISVATGSTNTHPAIIDVLDANDAVIGQIQVNPGDTYTFTQTSTGQSIMVHVYRTAPGFTLNAKWAEMAIYTDEITLQDGKPYNLVSNGDPNYNIKALLLWKNRDFSGGSSSTQLDSLREITLYDQDTFTGNRYVAGNVYNFPPGNPAFSLTYNGLDLTDADYSKLSIQGISSTTYRLSSSGNTGDCVDTTAPHTWLYTATVLQVTGDGTQVFGHNGDLLNGSVTDKFYYDPIGRLQQDGVAGSNYNIVGPGFTNTTITYGVSAAGLVSYNNLNLSLNGTENITTNVTDWRGIIFYKPSGFNCYVMANITGTGSNGMDLGPTAGISSTDSVGYDTAGSISSAQGQLWFASNNQSTEANTTSTYGSKLSIGNQNLWNDYQREIVLQEDAGRQDGPTPASDTPVLTRVPFFLGSQSWQFYSTSATSTNVYYQGIGNNKAQAYSQQPVITERGTDIYSVSSQEWDAKVARRIGSPTFTFAPVGANGTVSTGSDWIAKIGDTKSLPDGAVLTVKDITQSVGACVAGTDASAPACTVNMQPVTAVIMPDNVPTVQVSQPYDIKADPTMVMMDTDAANVGGVVITVGGPAVNTVTANVLKDANVDFTATSVVVKAYGNTIVVAGNTAADTMQAANEFIAALQTN